MKVAIIPDFTVMNFVKYEQAYSTLAKNSQESFECATEICLKDDFKMILAEQILQKLKFNPAQRIALEPFCEFDKTTLGVSGHTPENCVVETINTWLVKKVIVIYGGSIKLKFKKHHNLCVISPEKFIRIYKLGKVLEKRFEGKITLTEILVSLFFRY